MLRKPFFWLLPLAIWVFGGYFLGHSICCGGAAAGAAGMSSLMIKDGAATVAAATGANLMFAKSGAKPIVDGAGVKSGFADLVSYLKANPSKSLTLNGHYTASETNNTSFDNLGLARADELKGYLIGLGAPAAQFLTGSVLKSSLETNDNKVYGGMDYIFGTMAGGRSISIQDGADFTAMDDDNLVFGMSTTDYNKPLSDKVNGVFEKTADYLKANANRGIKITGLYTDQEEYKGILPNLGMGRANEIKGILTDMGVSSKQIELDSRMENTLSFVDDETYGAATYSFFNMAASGDKLAEVEKRLRANPLVLYFATGSETLNLNAQQRQYLADMIYYLDNKEGGRVNAVGHTDNRGAADMNRRLSRKRAEFVRSYLAKNGNINASLIAATGMGPDQPIETNDTEEGRAKNRRVEISIEGVRKK